VEQGLSEQGEAVLQVRVELGLPPWAEVSHWRETKSRNILIQGHKVGMRRDLT